MIIHNVKVIENGSEREDLTKKIEDLCDKIRPAVGYNAKRDSAIVKCALEEYLENCGGNQD